MSLTEPVSEFVAVVKIDRTGQEYRESMPRCLAEIAIDCILTEEPDVAYAWIEPCEIDRHAPYPARQITARRMRQIAFALADFLPFRLVA